MDLVLHAPNDIGRPAGGSPFLNTDPRMPSALEPLDREPLLVSHAFNLEEGLDILGRVLPLTAPGFLGTQEPKLGFPESQHIGGKAGQPAHFTDLVKELLADRPAGALVGCCGSGSHRSRRASSRIF